MSQRERPLPSALLGLGLGETADPMRELGPVDGHHVRRAHLRGGGAWRRGEHLHARGGLRAPGAVLSTSIAFGAAW